jgi:hypothetical protein
MRSNRCAPAIESSEGCYHSDRAKVMIHQDKLSYSCADYLGRRSGKEISNCTLSELAEPDLQMDLDNVDAVCREKMCEWSYRVCDHFQTGREIVAISFSYLDRFVDRCSCDRSAFKLAAMTTLYMATKIFGAHRVTISSLAELSRGEFEMSHISEMEGIILQTLGWRLNPPTAQCFVDSFYNYLPSGQGLLSVTIYQRAIFFVELSLYDYAFVTKERTLLALASILNAMEGIDEAAVSTQQQQNFVNIINLTFDLTFAKETVEAVRNRLWYVYSMSAQYREEDALSPDLIKKEMMPRKFVTGEPSSPSASPVSVAATGPHHCHHKGHQ